MLNYLRDYEQYFDAYTELRLQNNYSTRLMMRKGSLIQNSSSKIGGVSARCYQDGAFGFASMPDTDDAAIKRVMSESLDNVALFRRKSQPNKGPLPQTSAASGSFDYAANEALSAAQRIDVVRRIDSYIAEKYPNLVNTDVMMTDLAMEKALVTSEQTATYSYIPRANLIINFSIQANDGIVELYDIFGGFGNPVDHFADINWLFPEIDRLYQELREKAEGGYCQAGMHDVILDSGVAGILAHEAIGHTCEADLVLGGSVAGDYLGQTVASEKFTLIDHAERGPDAHASIAIHVDDEGTPCRDITIIENGVLKGFLHNKETARELGVEPTGNARAYTFSDEPLVRMRNTAIKPCQDHFDEMIAAVENGYYFKRSTNGQADATSEFMFGIGCGYEIRNGKIGRAIRDTTISGVAFDMLKTVTHISDDLTWSKGGMCGKKQLIPVGMGGPAVKCKVNVGGR